MRRKTLWISSLVVCATFFASWRASAQTPSLIEGDGARFVVTGLPETGPVQGGTQLSQLKVYPVDAKNMYVISSNGVAGTTEKLIYDNPLGQFAVELLAGRQLADDLTLSVKTGCPLTRYRFQIVGKANPNACGGPGMTCGPLQVDFKLFSECPGAGGLPIDGTAGCASTEPGATSPSGVPCQLLPDADALSEINFIPSVPVSLPSAMWLGVVMSRGNAGVVIGAPALKGFSDDLLDTSDFPCNADVGGFPASPHSSINASVYGDAACTDTFLTYQNIHPANSGLSRGALVCIADDIKLNRTCNMSQMEVAVRGRGRYDVELRRATVNGPVGNCNEFSAFGVSAIPGSRFVFGSPTDGLFVKRQNFDPPVPLPVTDLFAVLMSNTPNGRWVQTRQQASIGSTDATFFVFDGSATSGTWASDSPVDNSLGAFQITITCEGTPPVGACCDQILRDANNEAVCRDVPEINCAFPPNGSALRPPWAEGVSCHICSGGQRNGLGCSTNADCTAPRCVNGPNHNLACTGPADCPNGTCEPGTCIDNDPFVLPCGMSACCKPDGSCGNTTLNDCNLFLPLDEPRVYDLGQYCSIDRQRCPNPKCLEQQGDCLLPRPASCNGGPNAGQSCSSDSSCGGSTAGACEFLAVPLCLGGDFDGQPCANDLDCIPGGLCTPKRCNTASARPGIECEFPRDCRESFCERFVGCSNPFCCSDVCLQDDFCCTTEWDNGCANKAQNICTLAPSNDDCVPGDRTSGAVEVQVNGLAVSTEASHATDPGLGDPICCNGGQRRCVGGCADGEVCSNDVDCRGAPAGFCNFSGSPADGACLGGCNTQVQCQISGDQQNGVKTFCLGGVNNQRPCAPRCADGANAGQGCADMTACPFNGTCVGSVCVGGVNAGLACSVLSDCQGFAACTDEIDCPGGDCINDFCDGAADGFCGDAVPLPGAPGVGSVWYFFTVPPGVGDVLDVELSTCGSSSPAKDSMVQVYSIGDNDSGLCTETGRCAGDDSLCNIVAQDCVDGTACVDVDVVCSIAAQDCPAGAACELNKFAACSSLTLIGCNDDAADGCGDITQAKNSKLCLPNLRRGDTYYILVSAKSEATRGKYRLTVRSVSSCGGEQLGSCVASVCAGGAFDGDPCTSDAECAVAVIPTNDSCPFAEDLVDLDGDNQIIQRFDVGGATQDCRAPSCLGNLKNDVWYRYVAPATGQLLASTCGGSNATTPNTELIIYDGCDCGGGLFAEPNLPQTLCCSAIGDPLVCLPGSECDIQVVEGNCYMMRLGDNGGAGARGELTVTSVPDTGCPAGTVTWVDPQAGTVDARYAKDCHSGGAALGIDTITVTGPAGADPVACWSLCEPGGSAPMPTVVETLPGEYTITLSRPITPGSCTTITYDPTASGGPAQTAKISFLPADVNADGTAGPSDILELIDILNGVATSAWGGYSTDVDVSGATGAADILAVIDLLNGAGCFNTWNGASVEMGATCGTCPSATP